MDKVLTICGGGSLGHVIAGWISARGHARVNLLTGKPQKWGSEIRVETSDGLVLDGKIEKVGNNPEEIVPDSDVILLCLPGFLIEEWIRKIKPFLSGKTYVGSVFSSTGFFFEALNILGKDQPLWGFQRVPFISRVEEYGKSARLLGYKPSCSIAVENVDPMEKRGFARMIQDWFERPVNLLKNYYEASLTNSNPLLHTSRLYTMFGGKNEGRVYDSMLPFYEGWTEDAAEMYIKMDEELFSILKELPVSSDFLPTVLDYYESTDSVSLARKLSSIKGFKGIMSPMKRVESGWGADLESRYFTEDFPFGLKFIWQIAHEKGVPCPNIDKVFAWGMDKLNK